LQVSIETGNEQKKIAKTYSASTGNKKYSASGSFDILPTMALIAACK
jgi:hypothetical protein